MEGPIWTQQEDRDIIHDCWPHQVCTGLVLWTPEAKIQEIERGVPGRLT